jgi:hypothetical protein
MKMNTLFVLFCAALVALNARGALAEGGRALKTVSAPKRLVNAQVHLDKKVYQQSVTEVVARQEAINKVSNALDHADRKTERLNDRVDSAADRAAALQAKASQTGSIPVMRQAALAEVNVERVIRETDKAKDRLEANTDHRVQSALITQQRKEDAAGNKVERAQTRASAAQNDFNRFVARKGGPSSGLSLPTLGGGQQQQDGQYGSTDSQGPQLLGRGPILPFLP